MLLTLTCLAHRPKVNMRCYTTVLSSQGAETGREDSPIFVQQVKENKKYTRKHPRDWTREERFDYAIYPILVASITMALMTGLGALLGVVVIHKVSFSLLTLIYFLEKAIVTTYGMYSQRFRVEDSCSANFYFGLVRHYSRKPYSARLGRMPAEPDRNRTPPTCKREGIWRAKLTTSPQSIHFNNPVPKPTSILPCPNTTTPGPTVIADLRTAAPPTGFIRLRAARRADKMRLINIQTKRLETFYRDPTEPYAILSHTWGKEEEELSFQDMQSLGKWGVARTAKLEGCCNQAGKDGFKYIWIDTCCIDKTNAVELSEAITSMFRWYQKAAMCYTYLSDVTRGQSRQIGKSRWFTRGWTLQELLASPRMTFFDSSWTKLGTKSSLSGVVGQATGIPHHILTGITSLQTSSIAQKFSWAARRTTTRPEDLAYCLLGIFDVVIPPLYGEGLEAAFERLQEAIMKKTHDDSIFAWALEPGGGGGQENNFTGPAVSGGILAASPAAFEGCGDVVRRSQTETRIRASETIWGTIPISISLSGSLAESSGSSGTVLYGYLSCGPSDTPSSVVAIPLVRCQAETSGAHGPPVFLRPCGSKAVCIPKPTDHRAPETILIRKDRAADPTPSEDRSNWFYLPGPYPWDATIEEVYPADSFEVDTAMIKTLQQPEYDGTFSRYLVRFSYNARENNGTLVRGQFVLMLEFFHGPVAGSGDIPRAYLYFDNNKTPTPVSDILDIWWRLILSGAREIRRSRDPSTTLEVHLRDETIAGHRLWVLDLSQHQSKETTHSTPPDWPDISTQIQLLKDGHMLVCDLRKKATTSNQIAEVSQELVDSYMACEVTKKECEVITAEIARLTSKLEDLEDLQNAQHYKHSKLVIKLAELERKLGKTSRMFTSIENRKTLRPSILPEESWGHTEARRREREGIVSYIFFKQPIHVSRKKLNWVSGTTLLMYAAASGDIELVKQTLRYDDDLDATDCKERTALDWAKLGKSDMCFAFLKELAESRALAQPGMEKEAKHVPQPHIIRERGRISPPSPPSPTAPGEDASKRRPLQPSDVYRPTQVMAGSPSASPSSGEKPPSPPPQFIDTTPHYVLEILATRNARKDSSSHLLPNERKSGEGKWWKRLK